MDEQNARTSEETCLSTELKAESSDLSAVDSVREYLTCAEQIQLAHDQQTTAAGDKRCQELADVTSFARERVDGLVDDNARRQGVISFQSIATQGCLEDAKDSRALAVCVESSVHVDLDHQLHSSASVDTAMTDAVPDEQVDVGSKVISAPAGRAPVVHVDCVQEADVIESMQESVDLVMDEDGHGEASLEMLSGAVESFENMQRQGMEDLKIASNFVENLDSRKEHAENDVELEMEMDINDKSSVTKSTSEDNDSSVIDGTSAPKPELQDKEHILNMLCELAAVHQQEGELSRISKQVASCMTSLADSDAVCGEPRRLSFVDLLRKQMVHAGALTDLTADAIYEEFLRQNPEFLESKVGKDLNLLMSSVGISSNEGALELEGKSQLETSYRKEDTPTNEIVGNFRGGEIKLEEKGGGASKEKTRDEDKRFAVGDLVWAKVKSHPWWPGQIFDAADASVAAKKIQKPGRTLVAFFGDGTFGWLQQSQMIRLMPNFSEKVKQTSMKSFCRAVAEALDEVCRRMELGVRCVHSGDALYSPNLFPDLNVGIRKGVRLTCHQDIDVSKAMFQPESILKFIQTVACSPSYSLSSGLEYSKLSGHVYGFRSFMLSPQRPESKALSNTVKAEKKEKSVHSSLLKRRLGVDKPGGVSSSAVGKEAKRLHLSKEAGAKETSAGGRVQSPRFRSMETLLSTEAEEPKASESESKSHEQVKGNSWLAKGKRLHVSPDCKEKKSSGGWHSLGPLRDSKELGIKTTVDTSPDDGNKTLFDITGYHSLKRKKKGALKSTTDPPTKKGGQQLLGVRQELPNKQLGANVDDTREEEGLPDSGLLSVSMTASQPDSFMSPMAKDFSYAEEEKKDAMCQLDFKDTDSEDFMNVEKGNKDTGDPLNHDVEVSEQIKGESADASVNCKQDSEKQERNLLDAKVDDAEHDEKAERELNAKAGDGSSNNEEMLKLGVPEESQKEDLKMKQSESKELELGVQNTMKKHTKRLHSEASHTLRLSVKAKKRRQETQDKVEGLLSSLSENKEIVPRKMVKTSKLGLSMRKVAGALKGMSTSLKSAKHNASKDGVSASSIECEVVYKDTKRLSSGPLSPTRKASAAKRSANDESSLAKLLSILQVVATDPVSSANMRSSLKGVTSVFLKFRNLVFVKSSGYAATAAGKVMPPSANGHLLGEKKVDKGFSGRKSLLSEKQRSGSKDSSTEQKAPIKTESGSIVGPGSERDSSGDARAVASKEHRPVAATLGTQGSDVPSSSADNKAPSGDTPFHGKIVPTENQRLCVQDLAVAARKRKFEVLQESAAKVLGKSEAVKRLPEKLLIEKKFNTERVADTRLYAKSVKHHISKGEGLSYSEKRSPTQSSKVALGLFMQFPEDYTLPSETELKEVFKQFGTVETSGIRVYKNDSTAQVVFKHSDDAEAALQHARMNRMFGHANVSYRLRHFSLSSKSDSRHFSLAPAKEMRSSSVENAGRPSGRPSHSTGGSVENIGRPSLAKHSTSGCEKGVPLIPLRSSAGDSLLNRSHIDQGSLTIPEQASVDKASIADGCEPLPANSPARSSMVSIADPRDLRVVEQAPVQLGLPSRSEPVLVHPPASRLQPGSSTLPVRSCARSPPSSGAEPGGLVEPSAIYQQEAIKSPSSQSTLCSNFVNPPSVSNVNVSSGDIQDQMLKLLQQVSLIVSSTSLNPSGI